MRAGHCKGQRLLMLTVLCDLPRCLQARHAAGALWHSALHGLTTIPCLAQLQDASCFSCLDLQQAYHQVRLCAGEMCMVPPMLGRHHLTSLTLRLTHLRMLQSPGLSNGGGIPQSIDAVRAPHPEILIADDGPAQCQPSDDRPFSQSETKSFSEARLDWNRIIVRAMLLISRGSLALPWLSQ